MNKAGRVFAGIRILLLAAALFVAGPALQAATTDPDPTWIEIVQNFFATLLGDTTNSTEPDPGTIHIPPG